MSSEPARAARPTTAVILCGGRGGRLGALADELPKCLVPVHGEPLLGRLVRALARRGLERVVLPLGYRGAQVAAFAAELGADVALELRCVDTGEETPIAARLGRVRHELELGADFLLVNGDTLFDLDLDLLLRHHRERGALATLASIEVGSTYGLLFELDGRVVELTRQGQVDGYRVVRPGFPLGGPVAYVNSGIAWLNERVLELFDLERGADLEGEIFRSLIARGRLAHAHLPGAWHTVDTAADLERINRLPAEALPR